MSQISSESREEGVEEVLGEDLSVCNAGVTQDLECEELERPASIDSPLTICVLYIELQHSFF